MQLEGQKEKSGRSTTNYCSQLLNVYTLATSLPPPPSFLSSPFFSLVHFPLASSPRNLLTLSLNATLSAEEKSSFMFTSAPLSTSSCTTLYAKRQHWVSKQQQVNDSLSARVKGGGAQIA